MAEWDPAGKASKGWYLAGLFLGIGNIIAIIYVLTSRSKKKIFSLLYLVGFLGPLITYLVIRDEDQKLADLSLKLMIGNIIGVFVLVGAVVLLGLLSLGVL